MAISLMEHLGKQPQKFNVVTIHDKISQNQKKMGQYMPLKDIILNTLGSVLSELLDGSICSEETCHVRPLFCGKRVSLR